MRKTLNNVFLVIILFLTFSLTASELKIDDSFIIGKLDNQLTYYIKENKFHEDKASLRLLVKIGSAVETQEERGLAHFIEHLVFRGSENYNDYEVIKYLESIGAEFGPDTNAFTSFDKTCYILEIPIKNKQDLEKGFSFLSDFAFKAKLEEEKIDKERPVVLDELRLFLGPEMRVLDKHINVVLQDTSYENRIPIGKEEIVKEASYDTIRNFYKKWYTPQNIAIIAAGDFDKKEIEKYIKKYFSVDVENKEIPNYIVNPDTKLNFSIVNDPEISYVGVDLIAKENSQESNSKDLKEDLIRQIIDSIINERFRSVTMKADPDFIWAYFFDWAYLTNISFKGLSVQCWDEKVLKGLESALYEVKRLKNLGILESEFRRAVRSIKESIKEQKKNLTKIENRNYIEDCFRHFIDGDEIYTKESILQCKEKLLNEMTYEEVLSKSKEFDINSFCTVCITLSENITINQNQITEIIENAKHLEFVKQNEIDIDEQELTKPNLQIKAEIKDISKNEKNNITKVEFSNGMKFFLKPTNLKNDEILIRSYAIGGIANVNKDIYDSAKMAESYFNDSGIAGINSDSLHKLLDLKNSSLGIDLRYHWRGILADTTKDSFEDIIKLINKMFSSKNYQDDIWNKTIKMAKENQKFQLTNPSFMFFDKVNKIFYSDSYLVKDIDFDKVSLKNAQDIIDTFFSNPKDFSFFIAGDFEVDYVVLVLQKYLGSISDNVQAKIEMKDFPEIPFPDENKTQIVKVGLEDKSFCVTGYDINPIDAHDLKQWCLIDLMRPIIKGRLLNSLRLSEGKTYITFNYARNCFYPSFSKYIYYVIFSGPQEGIESLKDISINTLKEIIKNGITQEELETAKNILKNGIKEDQKYNTYIVDKLKSSQMFDYEYIEDSEKIIDLVSVEEMNSFIEKLFSKDKYTSVVWLPKDK